MKKVFAVLFTVNSLGSLGQCYNANDTVGNIFGNCIGQNFFTCAGGDEITIETYLGRWPIAASGDSVYIFNTLGDTIGKAAIDIVLNQVQVQQGVLTSQLQPVTIHVECFENFIPYSQYRWEVKIAGPDYYDAQWVGFWDIILFSKICQNATEGNSYSTTTEYYGNTYGSNSPLDIIATVTISEASTPCVGDCDNDGIISVSDLVCLVSEFGSTCQQGTLVMDFNYDCVVDISDLSAFISIYGSTCQ